jgi:hypothetical protein
MCLRHCTHLKAYNVFVKPVLGRLRGQTRPPAHIGGAVGAVAARDRLVRGGKPSAVAQAGFAFGHFVCGTPWQGQVSGQPRV